MRNPDGSDFRVWLGVARVMAKAAGVTPDVCGICRRDRDDLFVGCERCGAELHGRCYLDLFPTEEASWEDSVLPVWLILCPGCRS